MERLVQTATEVGGGWFTDGSEALRDGHAFLGKQTKISRAPKQELE